MNALFKYHKLAGAVENQPAFRGLDPVQVEILMAVGSRRHDEELLTVSNVLEMSNLASPATLHGRLKELRQRGFIEIVPGQDSRFKYLKPSALALEYYHALDRCIRKSVA